MLLLLCPFKIDSLPIIKYLVVSCDKWKVNIKLITSPKDTFIFVDHIAARMWDADSWVDNIRRLDYCCFFYISCFIVFNYQVN
jgi:hypothetical protein